jgi:hypothetical protein
VVLPTRCSLIVTTLQCVSESDASGWRLSAVSVMAPPPFSKTRVVDVGAGSDRGAVARLLADKVDTLPLDDVANNYTQWMKAWSDWHHFQPYVYTEFNNVLLNKLCEVVGK